MKPRAEKVCPVCHRPFQWRRRWARCWDDVRYCSRRCRRHRTSEGVQNDPHPQTDSG
ncbi:DUF2256 domain-containing protein [Ferrimonas balearica]|uniref:DUF2256 domain-containing protein n=1 Tax=Ferrimonas balearica TaxID=44012 RepID=UPI001C99C75C|nr:DUF2256 domain-containing protein [Ferrimonas balearica]MBY5920288.1 DUF2256 domain-containing protein [Ferrimonas balearica]MBY5997027.1 DUF2256 domain-containing protein [Ferrimonas balearica]